MSFWTDDRVTQTTTEVDGYWPPTYGGWYPSGGAYEPQELRQWEPTLEEQLRLAKMQQSSIPPRTTIRPKDPKPEPHRIYWPRYLLVGGATAFFWYPIVAIILCSTGIWNAAWQIPVVATPFVWAIGGIVLAACVDCGVDFSKRSP